MQKNSLSPGLTGTASFTVSAEHLAIAMGSGTVNVFATPMLIDGMENAAINAIAPYLAENMTTVGTHVDVSHNAATPLGMKVVFQAELTEISSDGRLLTFKVRADDEAGEIGSGTHTRVLVDTKAFEEKAATRLARKA